MPSEGDHLGDREWSRGRHCGRRLECSDREREQKWLDVKMCLRHCGFPFIPWMDGRTRKTDGPDAKYMAASLVSRFDDVAQAAKHTQVHGIALPKYTHQKNGIGLQENRRSDITAQKDADIKKRDTLLELSLSRSPNGS